MKLLARHPFTFSFLAALVLLPGLGAIDYEQTIFPILNGKCHQCHSGPRAKGKLRMDTADQFSRRIGGEHPVIVPGNPEASLMLIKASLPRTDGDAMPPPPARARGAEPLTAAELDLVRQWIAAGAKLGEGDSPATPEPAMTEVPAAPAPGTDAPASDAPAAMAPRLLEWSNRAGGTLQAYFVGLEGENVRLMNEARDEEIVYPFANLSDESQALARELAGSAGSTP